MTREMLSRDVETPSLPPIFSRVTVPVMALRMALDYSPPPFVCKKMQSQAEASQSHGRCEALRYFPENMPRSWEKVYTIAVIGVHNSQCM